MSTWSMMNLQDANSPMMENLVFFHDHSLMILLIITINIIYIILTLLINNLSNKYITQNQILEIIWTILPMMILIYIAIPSLKILYLTEELLIPSLTIKSLGHQWYWSFEYSNLKNMEFDSFMININNKNLFRLLDVDNRLILPFNNQIRLLVSSFDVIHSWSMPSLGIKIDAIPGRINQTIIYMNRPGLYFGQCSEICGMNHSFMPIVIESTNNNLFIKWMKKN